MHAFHGNKCFMVFHRDQSLVCLSSIYFCATNFISGVAVGSYADDTTPYSTNKTNCLVIKELEHFSFLNGLTLTTWK